MKNQLCKNYKWILLVVFASIIVICTVCGKEDDGHKTVVSILGDKYLNDNWNYVMHILNDRFSEMCSTLKEQSDNLAEDETVKADEESNEYDTESSKPDEESEEDEWDVDFEIVEAKYIYDEQRNGIEIYYPQFYDMEDSAKEERVNALIEEDVKKIIGEKNREGDNSTYCVVLKYKITFLNKRIISILYKGQCGYIMSGRARMPAKAITTTIDIEEEKIITLQDVVTDYTELSDMLLADEFEHITMWEGTTGGYEVSWLFNGVGYVLEEKLREDYKEWYTDGENFIIIIENRMADYNEYSISNESVRHILDAEFLKKLE